MSILKRLFRRKPATQTPPLSWKVWEYRGISDGWEIICERGDSVQALRMAILADRLFPDRNHRVSCRPQ